MAMKNPTVDVTQTQISSTKILMSIFNWLVHLQFWLLIWS